MTSPYDQAAASATSAAATAALMPSGMVERLAELGRLDANPDIGAALDRMTQIGLELMPGVLGISVTVEQQGETFTFGASNELVRGLDDAQYDGRQGPCVTALRTREAVPVPDLMVETRWPDWLEVARAAGVGSVLSVPVGVPALLPAALNTYATSPGALQGRAVTTVITAVAAHAGVLLANLETYGRAARLAQQLADALASRAVMEQAKGVLMTALATDADTAFAYMVRLSQTGNRIVRDVADTITADATSGRTRQRLDE